MTPGLRITTITQLKAKTEMVRKKADINLEEWLGRAAAPSEAKNLDTTAVKSDEVPKPSSTAERSPSKGKDELVTRTPADVAQTESESSEWFWVLLKQAGYEKW